jgi:uncharacterized membrane protein
MGGKCRVAYPGARRLASGAIRGTLRCAKQGASLGQALEEILPRLVAYGLSFYVIARFWDVHRTYFRHIQFAESRVVWMNLVALLWITLMPASTDLIGEHFNDPVAVSIYAVNLLLAAVSMWVLWRYVSSAGYLRRHNLPPSTDRFINV